MRSNSARRSSLRRPHALALALASLGLAAAAAAPPLAAAAASPNGGHFRLDKIKTAFAHACGFRVPGDKGAAKTVVVFASEPLDCAAADAGFDPAGELERQLNERGKGGYAVVNFDAEGQRADGHWRSISPSDAFSFGGQGKLEIAAHTESRLEGSYRTEKSEPFFDKSFDFSFRFALDLRSGALGGTAIPKGGGELGKLYQRYLKAVAASDVDALTPLVVASRAEEFANWKEAGSFREIFAFSRSLELASATISGGRQRGDVAMLEVEGKNHDGDKMRGQVFLAKENGTWKIGDKKTEIVFD